MYNPFSLEGKTILVTGASSGIGRQCAIDCSKMGAKVVAIARNKERLAESLSMMEGDNACYSYDLQLIEGIKDLIDRIVSENGKLDGFIHAAGIEVTNPLKLTSHGDYENLYRVNCLSSFEIVKNLCGIKTFNKGGAIVLISSISGIIARKGLSAYAASKGALLSAARVMAMEMAPRGVRVNTVSPGTILTPMMQKALDEMQEDDRIKRVVGFPLGLGQTTDISNACVYLLSDASRWVTGQNLIVDGGFTAQ
ncbi:MAG: SDR family oxidoreductase [Bacteroidales bacterium]|nr:SDR family oxidoreductase [Bacteroidales bacterium]